MNDVATHGMWSDFESKEHMAVLELKAMSRNSRVGGFSKQEVLHLNAVITMLSEFFTPA